MTTKPSQPSTSSRTTNNSLSSLPPVPSQKPPSRTSATQVSRSRTPPLPPSASNGYNIPSGSTTSNTARHIPLTVQTGSTVKVESPQITSLSSPAVVSAIDRLAPIRAAKASLASGTVSNAGELRTTAGSGADTPQTPAEPRQNPAVPQPAAYQTTMLSQRPPPPDRSLSQHLPANSGQGRPIPSQVEGVLRALRSQFPQLSSSAQSMSNVNPAITGHPAMTPSIPGLVNAGSASNSLSGHTPQGYGVGTSQETYNGNFTGAQTNPNQTPRSYGQRPSSSLGMSGNVISHEQPPPTMNPSAPTPAGLHGLPQRPAVVPSAPKNSIRAEPLGPPSRSVSSESAIPDGRRGPYSNDRHRHSDDRRSNRHDRNRDNEHGKRNWFRPRS